MNSGRKKSIPQIVLLVLVLLIDGYFVASRIITKIERKAQLEQAEKNAKQYIYNKYGFDADVVKFEAEEYTSVYEKENHKMTLKMSYDNKEFYVYVDSKEQSDYGCDDYQYKEIKDAVVAEISENMPKGSVMDIRIGNHDVISMYSNALFEEYFDGNNLDEVMNNKFGILEMIFADENIENEDVFNKLDEWDMDYKFTSFDTVERLEEFERNYEVDKLSFYWTDNKEYEIYAPYITNYIEIRDGEKSKVNFNTKECDEFKYCYFPIHENKYRDSSNVVTISETTQSYIALRFEGSAADWLKNPISKAYSFGKTYGDVCLYWPLDALKGYNLDEIGAAYFYDRGSFDDCDIAKAEICGEYAVFTLSGSRQSFMLVDITGLGEFAPEEKK